MGIDRRIDGCIGLGAAHADDARCDPCGLGCRGGVIVGGHRDILNLGKRLRAAIKFGGCRATFIHAAKSVPGGNGPDAHLPGGGGIILAGGCINVETACPVDRSVNLRSGGAFVVEQCNGRAACKDQAAVTVNYRSRDSVRARRIHLDLIGRCHCSSIENRRVCLRIHIVNVD